MRVIYASAAGILSGVSGVSDGLRAHYVRDHVIRAVFTQRTSGVLSTANIVLQGSTDDTNYFTMTSHVMTAAELAGLSTVFYTSNYPTEWIRVMLGSTAGAQVSQIDCKILHGGYNSWGVVA